LTCPTQVEVDVIKKMVWSDMIGLFQDTSDNVQSDAWVLLAGVLNWHDGPEITSHVAGIVKF
jgi:hypothetical protein